MNGSTEDHGNTKIQSPEALKLKHKTGDAKLSSYPNSSDILHPPNSHEHINGYMYNDSHDQIPATNGYHKMNGTIPMHNVNGAAIESFPEKDGESPPPIAIVGMGMRLPGGVNDESTFWDLLINKKTGRCVVPSDRYNVDALYNPKGGPETIKTRHGHFLEHVNLHHLDTSFFQMTRAEAEKLDPQQRLLLEVVWECMENAGQVGWRGKKIGCFVGVFGEDWLDLAAKDPQYGGLYRTTGAGDFAISNRVSYEYNLKGPSMTIRTGCSSAMISLHVACEAIYSGECHSALVAGTNLIITPTMTMAMSEQGVLSPSGECKTFDAKADGYARGEAINAVYIKKLSDAIHDGDPIRAIIRGTSINCDGKTMGMANPSPESHEAMIRRAYQVAQLTDLSKTGFVECHGTGTAVGDPLETEAVANVFGQNGAFIGSVKPNVGHSEGASGITSLIKTVLALEHKMIPPNINFSEPNPKIPFKEARLQVPVEGQQWPRGRERASVNSFGIGGANAHVILDSTESFGINSSINRESDSSDPCLQLLVFSANHPDSLKRSIANCEKFAMSHPHLLKDLAYTLGHRREHLPFRAFCVTDGTEALEASPVAKVKQTTQVAFIFTGQGAQWIGMGRQLLKDFVGFKNDMKAMDGALAELPDPPSWTIEGELAKAEDASRVNEVEFSQPLCTALQIGLVNLLRSWGISPTGVVGHSSGEIAAAYTANAITATAAIIIAYYRGQVTKTQKRNGGMLAVGMSQKAVTPYLIEGVAVACVNSPDSVTLSGDEGSINKIAGSIRDKQPDVLLRRLKVEIAYHSNHMKEVGVGYQALLEGYVPTKAMGIPLYSSVSGKAIHDSSELGSSYWRQNLESPVLFNSATQVLLSQLRQDSVLVEIGPHSALAGPVRQIFNAAVPSNPPAYIPSLIRGKDVTRSILSAIGQMHARGVPMNFNTITPGKAVLTRLPPYPWRHEMEYWDESRIVKEWRLRQFPRHELLGSRALEDNELCPNWRNNLSLEEVPWIQDHKIVQDVVFPATGYIAMAGEAIRQLTGTDDYTLQHVSISTALVLQESKTIEIMTSLRRVRLTATLDSDRYDFVISSYNGTLWTKHCTGQARAGQSQPPQTENIVPFHREVPAPTWYSAMKRLGLNYGPAFQGLRDISACPNSQAAVATIIDECRLTNAVYQIHPTTIDKCLQLFTVAATQGTTRRLQKLCMPTEIEEIYIRQGASEIHTKAFSSSLTNGAIKGDAVAMAGNETVIHLKGGSFSPLEDQSPTDVADSIAGTQLLWKPDVDFLSVDTLVRARGDFKDVIYQLERLSFLCVLETRHQVSQVRTEVEHLQKYHRWLDEQVVAAETGKYSILDDAQSLVELAHEERLDSMKTLGAEVAKGPGAEIGKILLRIVYQCKEMFAGEVVPISLLLQDDSLAALYEFYQEMFDFHQYFQLLGHVKPTMKILEIGAGTGGSTISTLRSLLNEQGTRMYSEYCFTDISTGFFVAAKEKFKDFENLKYAVLDISKDPVEQGFEAESFDLIIASNVLHATPSINATLRNVRKLLHPQGRFLLNELTPTTRKINYIMGILPGWWLGESDGRPNEPYIPVERWDRELRAAGFSGVDSVVYDNDRPYQNNAEIVSRHPETTPSSMGVTLLHSNNTIPLVSQLESLLIRRGFRVDLTTMNQAPPPNQDIISMVDFSGPFFERITTEELAAFQSYIGKLESSGVLWATRSIQMACQDPRYSPVVGAARTIRSELLVDFATMEIDTPDDFALEALADVFQKFQRRDKGPELDPDFEFALFERTVYIPRYRWISVVDQLSTISETELPRKLELGKIGQLQSLQWAQVEPIVLAKDEIEVETCAVGLNFKARFSIAGTKEGIGLEGAGIVRNVGSDVEDFGVGDRVILFEHGCFSTRIAVAAKLCAKIPDNLSFEEAATIPCVYSTVIYSLMTIGRLEAGQVGQSRHLPQTLLKADGIDQTVLIQSACGGVGLAAIQICQMIGAQIYATVGNDEKAEYLTKTFGIPRHRIFHSRNTSFLADVKRETNGRGVDIVLNSLSGELLHASWKCVAEFGKMLEIGKRDFIGRGMLSMDIFEANRAFFGIDLATLALEKPAVLREVLEQCLELYRQGAIGPIKPMKVFDAAQVLDAFKYMQKGQHIGKIVVSMPRNPQELSVTAVQQGLQLRPQASYLLVGGLGGLGRATAMWMVERGARKLIFLSRSAGKSDSDQRFFRGLEAQGCSVQAFCGDVTRLEDVKKCVAEAAAPVAGVMHMSMDGRFLEFTHEQWYTAVAPKVHGAWNLQEALSSEDLDFFILFSSISAVMGGRGQGNYSAANMFLESFVQYRQSLGQPASSIAIGVMEDVGYVSENPAVLEQFIAAASHTLREQDLVDSLQWAMRKCAAPAPSTAGYCNPAQLVIGVRSTKPLSDPSNRQIWKRDIRLSLYRNLETATLTEGRGANEELKQFLATVAATPSMLNEQPNVDYITHEIGKLLRSLMLQSEDDIDVKQSLTSVGIDSLVSIEIRKWWRQALGLEISVLEILNAGSIEQLGKNACKDLQQKYEISTQELKEAFLETRVV
ncbi:MAG: hypothetical protein Q9160_001824 [Pyrenula sp. 1 TL-2023]